MARPPYLPEAVAACVGAALVVAVGALTLTDARHALGDLGPTVGFLAALLVLADAAAARGSSRRWAA